MAYQKQNWQTGQTITADKLNHMEDGIGGDSVGTQWLLVHKEFLEYDTNKKANCYRLDKSFREIANAFPYVILVAEGTNNGDLKLPKNTTGMVKFMDYDQEEAPYKYKVMFVTLTRMFSDGSSLVATESGEIYENEDPDDLMIGYAYNKQI